MDTDIDPATGGTDDPDDTDATLDTGSVDGTKPSDLLGDDGGNPCSDGCSTSPSGASLWSLALLGFFAGRRR